MNNKNLLLGYGETLTAPVELKGGGGDKNYPYTYDENRPIILKELDDFINVSNKILDIAKPSNNVVAKLLLHPAFLSKTYFPQALLRAFSLNMIGSKSVNIVPRGYSKKIKKSNETGELSSACLYIAGSVESFQTLHDHLESNDLTEKLKNEIKKIEKIELFDNNDKIKHIDPSKIERKIEVAIHTPDDYQNILPLFASYARWCGAKVDMNRVLSVKGLSFLPMFATPEVINHIAEFTFLRTVRDLPSLRINNPVFTRTIDTTKKFLLPDSSALDENIKVAIFDGGIGCNDYNQWVNEIKCNPIANTSSDLLNHGQDVTSTVLFGPVVNGQKELPVPYAKIDHYRVLDDSISADSDLFDVLIRIKSVLEENDYQYVNLSLGPRLPVDDDDVHVWTSVLEQYFSDGKTLCTVAVGNDGSLPTSLNRIQPPSDLVNALAVGAADSLADNWNRCDYSCVGPGRSPGYVKPDGVAFGGSVKEPFTVYNPYLGGVSQTAGTSFASPFVLRQAIGLAASLQHNITPLTAKTLLIHHTSNGSHDKKEVGWGRFPTNLDEMLYCGDDEVKVIYQGELAPSQHVRIPIPFPSIPINGKVHIKATFCFSSAVDAEHPLNYTRNGLVVVFRTNKDIQSSTKSFFNLKGVYSTEQELREDAHKWETTLHKAQTFQKGTLNNPCFDVIYYRREAGMSIDTKQLEPLPYVLVVSVKADNTPELYNNIVQRYQTLSPIKIKQQVRINI